MVATYREVAVINELEFPTPERNVLLGNGLKTCYFGISVVQLSLKGNIPDEARVQDF